MGTPVARKRYDKPENTTWDAADRSVRNSLCWRRIESDGSSIRWRLCGNRAFRFIYRTIVMALSVVHADLENPSHRAAIPFLVNAYAQDPIGGGRPIDPRILERIVPGLQAHPTTLVFLAFDGDEPVGIANCFLGYSTFRARPLLNVHDLAVVEERRGEGIGRMLMGAAEEKGRELGCCKLTLEVREDNYRARALYESFGFGDYSTGARPTPTIFLEKSL